MVLNVFNTDIVYSKSLSSISFNCFKKNYNRHFIKLKNAKFFKKDIQQKLRLSYRGGIVDVYKPYGENLFCYDINSSYPHSMTKFMPVGYPICKKKITISDYFSKQHELFG